MQFKSVLLVLFCLAGTLPSAAETDTAFPPEYTVIMDFVTIDSYCPTGVPGGAVVMDPGSTDNETKVAFIECELDDKTDITVRVGINQDGTVEITVLRYSAE
jgi:hypothetical protein